MNDPPATTVLTPSAIPAKSPNDAKSRLLQKIKALAQIRKLPVSYTILKKQHHMHQRSDNFTPSRLTASRPKSNYNYYSQSGHNTATKEIKRSFIVGQKKFGMKSSGNLQSRSISGSKTERGVLGMPLNKIGSQMPMKPLIMFNHGAIKNRQYLNLMNKPPVLLKSYTISNGHSAVKGHKRTIPSATGETSKTPCLGKETVIIYYACLLALLSITKK